MSDEDNGAEVQELCRRLVRACGALGLVAMRKGIGGVHASMPAGGMLSEVVTCEEDDDTGVLHWWWSWGERFCPASEVEKAAAMIKHVVTPAHV